MGVSRLRGMEARGYEFKRPTPQTGADYGGDMFSGGRREMEDPDIKSYTPYLVSNKTKTMDVRQILQTQGSVASPSSAYSSPGAMYRGSQSPNQHRSHPNYLPHSSLSPAHHLQTVGG